MWDLTLIPVEKPVLPVPLTTVENPGYNAMFREAIEQLVSVNKKLNLPHIACLATNTAKQMSSYALASCLVF
jgi:hypothetical protein